VPSPLAPDQRTVAADIRRIVAIWKDTWARFGKGAPLLFGGFSCADALAKG
jgi:hypothetical protein